MEKLGSGSARLALISQPAIVSRDHIPSVKPACLAGIATVPIIIKPLHLLGHTIRDCSLPNQRADKLRARDNISIVRIG